MECGTKNQYSIGVEIKLPELVTIYFDVSLFLPNYSFKINMTNSTITIQPTQIEFLIALIFFLRIQSNSDCSGNNLIVSGYVNHITSLSWIISVK